MENLTRLLSDMEGDAKIIGLPEIAKRARRIREDWIGRGRRVNDINTMCHGLLEAIEDDVSEFRESVFKLNGVERELYSHQQLSQEAQDKFPDSCDDMAEAGRCLAFNRYTASVFHSMRALESPLHQLAAALGVVPKNPNWQNIINSINSAIKSISSNPTAHGSDWRDKEQKYSEMANDLRFIKDAWRNYVMHKPKMYGPEDALNIFNHVRLVLHHMALGM